MKADAFSNTLAVALPVSSLRTQKSCGVGEFLDLMPFAEFCKLSGISLIQLLPIYDSGTDSSPYNILSAFALHPLYLSLESLEGAETFAPDIQKLKEDLEGAERFNYSLVLEKKCRLAKCIFEQVKTHFLTDLANPSSEVSVWLSKNDWVKSYALFKNIKDQHFQSSWTTWAYMRTPTKAEIEQAWNCPALYPEFAFYTWLQFNLHLQLLQAAQFCKEQGVLLKGDIPILLNEDSCDVWEHHELFRTDIRAGSPPDAENMHGQAWGFPVYFWENHKESGYKWWKFRLAVASQYYAAYRIDHVLGFFRIWATQDGESGTSLGRAIPEVRIKMSELHQLGFSAERIRWMSEPHIKTEIVMEATNGDYLYSHGQLHKIAERINDEELWLFKKEIGCEADIGKYGLDKRVEQALKKIWIDRMLVRVAGKHESEYSYVIAWKFKDTTAWQTFSEDEQRRFLDLVERTNEKSERLWKKHGNEILSELCTCSPMQAFAEDLGAIPECVPSVLKKLGIFSLKVLRWQRNWDASPYPFIDISCYPSLSVTTTSTHDTSTLLEWWNTELTQDEKIDVLAALHCEPSIADEKPLSVSGVKCLLRAISLSPSKVLVLPIQDILCMTEVGIRSDARINTPGTVSEQNWSYRMPITVENLCLDTELIRELCLLRRQKNKN